MGASNPSDSTPSTGYESPTCPAKVTISFPNPGGLQEGETLEILLEGAGQPVLVLATQAGVRLGVVAGIPRLGRLIQCILDGVTYAASVLTVGAGSVDCIVVRQDA